MLRTLRRGKQGSKKERVSVEERCTTLERDVREPSTPGGDICPER